MYTFGCFMLMYGINKHNIVKQLSSNKKFFFKKCHYHHAEVQRSFSLVKVSNVFWSIFSKENLHCAN